MYVLLFQALAIAILGAETVLGQQPDRPSLPFAGAMPSAAAPQSPPAPAELGDQLMLQQRYQAAIEAYKNAPQDAAETWNKLGIAYQMMFDYADAIRSYRASLKIEPANSHVLNNLGTVYGAMKRYDLAEKMYRKALRIEPRSALVLKNLGTDLLARHKYKKGWEAYQAALAVDPQVFDRAAASPRADNPASVEQRGAVNYYMAKGCLRAGKKVEAIQYLRRALNEGFTTPKKILADQEFAALRGLPAFDELMASQADQPRRP